MILFVVLGVWNLLGDGLFSIWCAGRGLFGLDCGMLWDCLMVLMFC